MDGLRIKRRLSVKLVPVFWRCKQKIRVFKCRGSVFLAHHVSSIEKRPWHSQYVKWCAFDAALPKCVNTTHTRKHRGKHTRAITGTFTAELTEPTVPTNQRQLQRRPYNALAIYALSLYDHLIQQAFNTQIETAESRSHILDWAKNPKRCKYFTRVTDFTFRIKCECDYTQGSHPRAHGANEFYTGDQQRVTGGLRSV